MKSDSTMMWLTTTPDKLMMPMNAMKPSDVCVTARPVNAPMSPSGTVSMTTMDFVTELNWMTIASVISASEIIITRPISSLLLFNSFSSPAYSSLQPGGSWTPLIALRARARTLEGSSPKVEKDITVTDLILL